MIATFHAWLEELPPNTKPLVILDTVGKILPRELPGESQYQRDYRISGLLKRVCDQRPGTGLIGLHHDRKSTADDFVATISGTHGLAGAADSIVVSNRPRKETKGLLKVTGRDVEENEYGVKLLDGAWSLIGGSLNEAAAAAETIHKTINLGDRSTAIVELVDKHPKGVRAADVAKALGIEADVAAVSLRRLANAEAIRKGGRGLFLPSKSVRSVLLTNQQNT